MRRAAAFLAGCALLLLAACDGAGGDPDTAGGDGPPVLPSGSSAKRWVGVNGAMLAVPTGWRTATGSDARSGGAASLTFAPTRSGQLALPSGARTTKTAHGLTIRHSPVACVPHQPFPEQCSTTVLVAEADAAFRLTAPGRRGGELVRRVLASLRPVPDGYTAVPAIGFGTSVEAAGRELDGAGLDATSPDVEFPHYATGTDPAAGSIVRNGSTVSITIGDG